MKSIDTVLVVLVFIGGETHSSMLFLLSIIVIQQERFIPMYEPILYTLVPFSPRLFVRFYGTSFMMKLQIIRPRDFVHFNI